MASPILATNGKSGCAFSLAMANRHGLIAGATGTGKTVTLQSMAEYLSNEGVPVFLADVKGDLAGLSAPGGDDEGLAKARERLGAPATGWRACPVTFWDVFGKRGHPVRATVSEFGPLLLARMLGLSDVQREVLTVMFRIADSGGLLLLDLKDLRALVEFCGKNASELEGEYGRMSQATLSSIQRSLLALEDAGASAFFGEPALSVGDFVRLAPDGRGMVNILAADELFMSPALYSTFLLWLLSELFEEFPERGDAEKPVIAFFFDEAHLLFEDAPDALLDKVKQVIRLVRSKGIGVYFVTQNPADVPDDVLGQLGNRVQHALRAFTPRDRKAVRTVAQTFRPNPALDVEAAVTELATGEALVSFLDAKGMPAPVERAFVIPPLSRVGTISADARRAVIGASPFAAAYAKPVDRESAYEILKAKAAESALSGDREKAMAELERMERASSPENRLSGISLEDRDDPFAPDSGGDSGGGSSAGGTLTDRADPFAPARKRGSAARAPKKTVIERAAEGIVSSAGRELGRQLVRGVLGSLLGSRRR